MSGPEPEALEGWAEARNLAFAAEATLPPVTENLRLGLGVGEHRASMRTVTDEGRVWTGGQKKRPERQTLGVCRGQLPGGLDGLLGHHVYLSDRGRGQEDRYIAITSTVVFAELPCRARPVFHLRGGPAGEPDVKAAFTIGSARDVSDDPLAGVVPSPRGKVDAGGMGWTSFPAEPEARLRRIGSSATRFLDGLPADRVEVEYECGRLAVWVRGRVLSDDTSLDQLCRFASALAANLAEVAGDSPALDPAGALPLPEPDDRDRWVRAGADLIDWPEPPVSVAAAQGRYRDQVKSKATRTGWSVYGIVALVLFLASLLVAALGLAASLILDQIPLGLGIMIAVISVGFGALAANRIGLQAGQETKDDRIEAGAVPWGIEAFTRGYANQTGLAREDGEEFRRRLAVPFNGRCQIAWQGELSPGNPGHLSVWIDATNSPEPPRFYLLVVTATRVAGEAPAGYEVLERDGLRLLWQEVRSSDRSAHRLEQLRQAAGPRTSP